MFVTSSVQRVSGIFLLFLSLVLNAASASVWVDPQSSATRFYLSSLNSAFPIVSPCLQGETQEEAAAKAREVEASVAALAREEGLDQTEPLATRLRELEMAALKQVVRTQIASELDTVAESESRAWYEANVGRFVAPEVRHVYPFFAMVTSEESEEAQRNLLESIRERIVAGTALSIVRREASPMGVEIATTTVAAMRGRYPQEMEDVIFSLEPGGVSPVVRTRRGWHFFLLQRVDAEKNVSYGEARPEIENALRMQASEVAYREILNEYQEKFPVVPVSDFPSEDAADSSPIGSVGETTITLGEFRRSAAANQGSLPPGGFADHLGLYLDFRAEAIRLRAILAEHGAEASAVYTVLLETLQNNLLATVYVDSLREKIEVTDEELQAAFEAGDHKTPKQWQVREVVIPREVATASENPEDILRDRVEYAKRVLEVREELAGGPEPETVVADSEWAETARIVDWGTNQMGPRGFLLDTTVEHLKAGEVSRVQQTDKGYHIFLVEAVIEPRPMSFEEAKESVRRMLITAKWEEQMQELACRFDQEPVSE